MPTKKVKVVGRLPFDREAVVLHGARHYLSDRYRRDIELNYQRMLRDRARATARILPAGFEREDTSWQDDALCITFVDPEVFFPVKDEDKRTEAWKDYCDVCPVRELCGDYGERHNFQGVWGGVYRPGPELSARTRGRPKLSERVS